MAKETLTANHYDAVAAINFPTPILEYFNSYSAQIFHQRRLEYQLLFKTSRDLLFFAIEFD